MKNRQTFLIVIFILMAIVAGVVITLIFIGRSYEGGLRGFENKNTGDPIDSATTRTIRKVTLRNNGESKCTEIGVDGVVRIYETCGGEVSDAFRTSESRVVSDFFNRLGSGVVKERPQGSFMEVVVETESGETMVVYIPTGGGGSTGGTSGGSDPGGSIIDLIDTIVDSSPTPIPTYIPQSSPSPYPTGVPGQPTATPTPFSMWYQPPTPTPTGTVGTFTCDFVEGDGKVPYRVSNVVCSTEPVPVP